MEPVDQNTFWKNTLGGVSDQIIDQSVPVAVEVTRNTTQVAGNVGAQAVHQCARSVEGTCPQHNVDAIDNCADAVQRGAQRVQQNITQELGRNVANVAKSTVKDVVINPTVDRCCPRV